MLFIFYTNTLKHMYLQYINLPVHTHKRTPTHTHLKILLRANPPKLIISYWLLGVVYFRWMVGMLQMQLDTSKYSTNINQPMWGNNRQKFPLNAHKPL